MKATTVKEMRALDLEAEKQYGISPDLLMENAGGAVYEVIRQHFGVRDKSFVIFCGGGNNGADGLVVARKLHSAGAAVWIFFLTDPEQYMGAGKMNYQIARRIGLSMQHLRSPIEAQIAMASCDAIVDGILGTGLTRAVDGLFAQIIELINSSGKPVISIDIPSGINGDNGKVMGCAIHADHTITFGLPKIGCLLYPGYSHCGNLTMTPISFPVHMVESPSLKYALNTPVSIPERKIDIHKGDMGDILFIAGASSYLGAPYFSAMSFLKTGGGYARLAAPRSITPFIAIKGSEIVFNPLEETSSGTTALANQAALLELSGKADMVVLGPGLSLHPETQDLARNLIREIEKPLLIDGDGLTALSSDLSLLRQRAYPTILTPHTGEMARLTHKDINQIEDAKLSILQKTSIELNTIIILKGAHSLISYPDGQIFINMTGNPGMATAGSGDILTGVIAGMVGLGLPLETAARMGVLLHGLAGDLAAEDIGQDGITAQDILDHVPAAINIARRKDSNELTRRGLGLCEI